MAIVEITGTTSPNIKKWRHCIAQIKSQWANDWLEAEFLQPLESEEQVAPGMGVAKFRFDHGRMLKWTRTVFEDETPFTNIGCKYIRIVGINEGSYMPLWYGVIQEEDWHVMRGRNGVAGGTQIFQADGMESLLDRVSLLGAKVKEGEADIYDIDCLPTFNERPIRGAKVLGNRTLSSVDNIHYFSSDGEEWNALFATRYILLAPNYVWDTHAPDGPAIYLAGQTSELQKLVNVWDLEGRSLRQALNILIDRRRGLGWFLEVLEPKEGEEGPSGLCVNIFTCTAETISVGDISIAGNNKTMSIDLDLQSDMVSPSLKITHAPRYDRVDVIGQPMMVCCTLEKSAGHLIKGWSSAEETAYKAASDLERATDKYRRVFSYFKLDPDWNKKVIRHDIGGSATVVVAIPPINADGTVNAASIVPASFWPKQKSFERHLPIEQATDEENAQVEYLPALLFFQNPVDSKWIQADRAHTEADVLPNVSLRMADHELGLYVNTHGVNHQIALNRIDFSAEGVIKTDFEPRLDYETLRATVMFRTDSFLKVSADIPRTQNAEVQRSLVIQVQDAELWYVAPGTMIGVTDGVPNYHAGDAVRDDSQRVRAIAALAKIWYGKPRATVNIKYATLEKSFRLGTMLTQVTQTNIVHDVNTVVSSLHRDYEKGTTTIRTAFAEIDLASAAGSVPGMDWGRAVNPKIIELERKLVALGASTGAILSRQSHSSEKASREFRIVEIGNDYLICEIWNNGAAGTGGIIVAKEWLNRRTPFDGQTWGGISYVYTNNQERVATNEAEETETQVVNPYYIAGDIIRAMPCVGNEAGFKVAGVFPRWIENNQGRAWAKKFA